MKKIFKRLVCCSFLSIASIWSFNAEARVTKEVAEAVLPFLMEAAGIPGDTEDKEGKSTEKAKEIHYKKDKIQAILNMIYTDEGQQQMVKWAVNNERPTKLAVFGELFSNEARWLTDSLNKKATDKNSLGERCFQKLFPCNTGTFTSFANCSLRFGCTVLTKYESVKSELLEWIKNGTKPSEAGKEVTEIGNTVDCKIAKIIFILDIFDDLQQIYEVCVEGFKKKRISKALAKASEYTSLNKDTVFSIVMLTINPSLDDESNKKLLDDKFLDEFKKKNNNTAQYDDFRHKVIPDDQIKQIVDDIKAYSQQLMTATSELKADHEYTCRPVSATIANKEGDCVETLYRHLINIAIQDPTKPQLLHTERLPTYTSKYFGDKTPKEIKEKSFSGATSIKDHNKWRNALQSVADLKTYFNISSGAVYNIARTLEQIAFFYETKQAESFFGSEDFAGKIAKAMNKLASHSQRFSVIINDSDSDEGWITKKITILDELLKRTIVIGICEDISNDYFGHAEIISIKKHE